MLKNSLIAKTSPKANARNTVRWKKYRVSVLSDRLFRIERSEEEIFRDGATQSVWFRDMPVQAFKYRRTDLSLIIDTGACKLIIKENRADCRVLLGGKRRKIENANNLGGTYRTLDQCDGGTHYPNLYRGAKDVCAEVNLGNGVCSKSGVAVFDDAPSLTLSENGEIIAERGHGTDEYVFAYGDDYRGAVQALYRICGKMPIIPRFALGNWWSRYHAYTDEEYLTLLTEFSERDVPLSVATVDMDWHYSDDVDARFKVEEGGKNTPFYGGNSGWTGYTWNEDLFPNYRNFLSEIEAKNLKITLNLHPADGVRWWENVYPQMATAMGIDPQTEEQVKFDITDSKFINAYFDILHKPYEREGVTFWWIDWQQGENTKIAGLDPLWSLNHYHYLDNAENHFTPLILSRYAGIGSHRYPLGFSGDTFVTWKTLKYLPYFTATATNVGYTWWSHDIGGHMRGAQQNELYLRHVEYGVFSPINRLHGSNAVTMTKEPWIYENGTGEIAQKWLRFRHSLLPFLYTWSHRTHSEGLALVEPLYYEWKDKRAYMYREEYLFGGFLVAPIVTPVRGDGYARVKAWLPEGEWTDIFTGDKYFSPEGGKEITFYRTMESIPVLARAGEILPRSLDRGNGVENPQKLQVDIYRGNGAFELFEDGREKGDCREAFTLFESKMESESKQTLKITFRGEREVLPDNRVIRVNFADLFEGTVAVYKNGEKQNILPLFTETVCIELAFEADAEYFVEVEFEKCSRLDEWKARAGRVLLRAECEYAAKEEIYHQLQAAVSVEEYVEKVNACALPKIVKLRLTETV